MDRIKKFYGQILLVGGLSAVPGLQEMLQMELAESVKYEFACIFDGPLSLQSSGMKWFYLWVGEDAPLPTMPTGLVGPWPSRWIHPSESRFVLCLFESVLTGVQRPVDHTGGVHCKGGPVHQRPRLLSVGRAHAEV